MIKWKLREVMARKKISNRKLAQAIGMHETSISRMKSEDVLPRVDNEYLSKICKALDCTPSDLLEYVPDAVEAVAYEIA